MLHFLIQKLFITLTLKTLYDFTEIIPTDKNYYLWLSFFFFPLLSCFKILEVVKKAFRFLYKLEKTQTHACVCTHIYTLIFHGLSSKIWFAKALKVYFKSALNIFQGSKDLSSEHIFFFHFHFFKQEQAFSCNRLITSPGSRKLFKVRWSSVA